MAKKIGKVISKKHMNNIIQFKSAEQLEKEELFEHIKKFLYDPDVSNVLVVVNYGNISELGAFTSSLTTTIEALGILELAKNCFRGS